MKKLIIVVIAIAVLVTIAFFGWRLYKSKNEPIVLAPSQINETLETLNSSISIEGAGLRVPVKNKTSKKVQATVFVRAAVYQNGDVVREAYDVITETWEPQEEKKIFMPYKVNKYYNDSGAHDVMSSVSNAP